MNPTKVIASKLLDGTRWYTVWLTGAQLVVIVVAAVINGRVNEPVDTSVWQVPAVLWIRYPLVGLGAMLSTVWLPVFVANGVTRRQFLRGAALFGVAVVTILAAVGIAGFVAERLVYAVGDVDTNLGDQQPLRAAVVYLVLLGCYFVSGLLIGAATSRWTPRQAPWMITLFVAPMIAGELVLGTLWGGVEGGDLRQDVPLALGLPLMVAVVVGAAAVGHVLLRDVALKPKKG